MRTFLLSAFLLLAVPFSAEAAAFAKYDGVDGESKDANHDKWIDVLSIDWGINKPGGGATGQSRRRGDVILEDLSMTFATESASPQLVEAILTGRNFPSVDLDFTRPCGSTGQPVSYLKYKLKDVIITSYNIGSSGQDGVPTEDFSLNFEEIKVTYTAYDDKCQPGRNVEFSWNVGKGNK